MIDKNSKFYINAKAMLDEYVAGGGNVNDLGIKDKIYAYIKNAKIKDENGVYIDTETKFELLGHSRARAKRKDIRQELIDQIEQYRRNGGSFHITRNKLPFYPQLRSYVRRLQNNGIFISNEEIMKGLGYKEYSDVYFRCMGIFDLSKYRDKNGFVDSYRKNETLKSYITGLAGYLEIPNYLVVTLLGDENLERCHIATEYISQVKSELQQYCLQYGSLKGLKTNNKRLYYKLDTLMRGYGYGEEVELTKDDWLRAFELDGFENDFRKSRKEPIDINPIMEDLRKKFGDSIISAKDIDSKDYRKIVIKAYQLAIPNNELFRSYGLNYSGNVSNRLSTMQVYEIPYLDEMRTLRDKLLEARGINAQNGYCEEEIFEARVEACKYVYSKYKDKMFNFTIDESQDMEDSEKIGF